MSRFHRHVFVCLNERPPDNPKGCCLHKGSGDVLAAIKAELKKRSAGVIVRANKSGCLDACEFGVTVVVYPEGIWYGRVRKEDAEEIVERTVIKGEVIQRLLIPSPRFRPDALQFRPLDIPPDTIP